MDYTPPSSSPQDYDIPPAKVKKPRGCLFYGCLISSILALLAIIAIVGLFFFAINWINNFAKEYTDTKPEPIPASAMPLADRDALKKRVDAYFEDLKAGKADQPLVLTAEDFNALIEENETFKKTVHVDIEGDKVKGKISFPIRDLNWPFKDLNGRYFNGSATLTHRAGQRHPGRPRRGHRGEGPADPGERRRSVAHPEPRQGPQGPQGAANSSRA